MASIKSFEEFDIWRLAQELAADIYAVCDLNTKIRSDFSFRDQIKRAALSISNNIAEGFEYNNNKEFLKFLKYAKGSCGEVRNCLFFAIRVSFVEASEVQFILNKTLQLSSQIGALMKYLRNTEPKPRNS